jgi:nitrogenase subunit NifH
VSDVRFVASKVSGGEDVRHIERLVGATVFASIPLDEAVVDAERDGVALIDAVPESDAVRAIERLAEEIAR